MADKMMRIAGRGTDGTAKPISTDNTGYVQVSGTLDDLTEQTSFTNIPTANDGTNYFTFASPKRFVTVYNHSSFHALLVDYRCSAGGVTYYPSTPILVPAGCKLELEGKAITLVKVLSKAFPVELVTIIGGN